jgi:hypothetical protein
MHETHTVEEALAKVEKWIAVGGGAGPSWAGRFETAGV